MQPEVRLTRSARAQARRARQLRRVGLAAFIVASLVVLVLAGLHLATGSSTARRAAPPKPPPTHYFFTGDSIAVTLGDALAANAASRGLVWTNATQTGCGAIPGQPAVPTGATVGPLTCGPYTLLARLAAGQLAGQQVVVVLSTWEVSDRLVGGHFYAFHSKAWEHEILTLWTQTLNALQRARIGRLVIIDVPARAQTSAYGLGDPVYAGQVARYDRVLARLAATHAPTIRLVHLTSIICPHNACPAQVGGVTLRPVDGAHFSDAGAAWTAPQLLAKVVAAAAPRNAQPSSH